MLPTPPASPKPLGASAPEELLGQLLAQRYRLVSILGVGAYGTVYKAVDTQTGVQYAVKALNKLGLDPRQRRFQEREIELHHQASRHPNVVSLDLIVDTPECTYVFIEFCSEGDLFSKITEEGQYVGNDFLARRAFLQILDAVEYCHSLGIYHRDLKPENILVKDNGYTVKLADFGLATRDRVTSDFGCGSTFYMSPECQQSAPKAFACYGSAPNDIWSLGVILVNLTCGRNPWKRASSEDSTFRAYMRDSSFLQSILPLSDELNSILRRIFELDPRQRISIPELRSLIMGCRRFTQSVSAPTTPPASPPYTIADAARDGACLDPYGVPEFVPSMDQLPGPQYPVPEHGKLSPACSLSPASTMSPPASAMPSPSVHPYTYPTKSPTHPTSTSFTAQTNLSQVVPVWSRCSQYIPAFNMPRPGCFWNVQAY